MLALIFLCVLFFAFKNMLSKEILRKMKKGIHPDFVESVISCACGNKVETRSIKEELSVEICSHCHPFFTGEQRLLDVAGRVEKFQKKFGDNWKSSVQKRNDSIKETAKGEKDVKENADEAAKTAKPVEAKPAEAKAAAAEAKPVEAPSEAKPADTAESA